MYPIGSNSSLAYTGKMDDHFREILNSHRSKFSQIDVERLIPFLRDTGLLTGDDLDFVRRSPGPKMHTLLDLLPSKGSQAFQSLCLALENTSPHLLTMMLSAAIQRIQYYPSSRQGSIAAGLTSDSECDERKSAASSPSGDGGVAPPGGQRQQGGSSPPQQQPGGTNVVSSHDFNMEQSNVALLKAELKIVTKDRDVLKKELKKALRERDDAYNRLAAHASTQHLDQGSSGYGTLSKHGSSSASEKNIALTRELEAIKMQYEKTQLDLQALRKDNADLARKCDTHLKDIEYYRKQERLSYNSLQNLRLQYEEVVTEKQKLEHEVTSLQTIMEDDRKEIADLRRQQQEAVTQEGSGEAINQLYITTLRKYEALKDDYDSMRKRYADMAASHSNNISKLELTQEEASRIQKQYEEVLREKNCLKQQCTEAIRQWDTALREKNKLQEEILKVREKNEEIVKEMNAHHVQRQSLSKELKRLQDERNAAMQEYTLVMSERDTVHKEMDKLQEELNIASKKIKSIEQSTKDGCIERESLELQLETLKREVAASLHDRDKALRECNELRERFGAKDDVTKDWEHPYKDYDSYKQEREMKLMEGSDLVSTSHEMYAKAQKERLENLDQANQEIDRLRKTVEKLQSELQEAKREAEVSKRRRDWAFSERDKIVQERESIRAHCDKLRHERDRAVSELAEALRDSDDMMKQRNKASNELKELKERLEAEQEKSTVARHMVTHTNSRDSAIDTDMHEWEIEYLQVQLGSLSEHDIGFEFCGGSDDPHYGSNDGAVFVSSITKDGPFDGKLRVHDQLLAINNIQCTGATKSAIYNAIRSSRSWLRITFRRRKSDGKSFYQAHLHCPHPVLHGLTVRTQVCIANILPGSPAAKEGNLSIGDRIISINEKSVDNLSCEEAQRVLDSAGEIIQLITVKTAGSPSISAPLSSSSSGQIIGDDEKSLSSKLYSSSSSSPSKETALNASRLVTRDLGLRITRSIGHPQAVEETSGGRRLGSNERVYTVTKPTEEKVSSSGGSGAWGQFKNIVKPRRHSKENMRIESRGEKDEKKKNQMLMVNIDQERENDALAELDSVINSYHYMDNAPNSSTTKRPKKKEKEKSGGTWPKYKGGTISLCDPNSGTLNGSHWRKDRPPLSMFLPISNSGSSDYNDSKVYSSYQSKNTLPRMSNSPMNPRSRNFSVYKNHQSNSGTMSPPYNSNDHYSSSHITNSIYSDSQTGIYGTQDIYCSISPSCGSIEHKSHDSEKERGHHNSPDTSLDFSVRSGNVGKEELEYYAKKNRSKYPTSDSESNFGMESPSQPSSLPPVYMSRPSPLHHLGERIPSNSRLPHTHSGLYSPPNSALRVPSSFTPYSPLSFPMQHPHNHLHTTINNSHGFSSSSPSPHYSSPPLPIIGNSPHFLSQSRSGDSILPSPGPDRDPRDTRGYYENQISLSPTSSMGGGFLIGGNDGNSGNFYHSTTTSMDAGAGGSHHKLRTLPSHSQRAASDEPSGGTGRHHHHDYLRSISTIPRKKDDERIKIPSNFSSKCSSRVPGGFLDHGSEGGSDRDSEKGSPMPPINYSVELVGSSSSLGHPSSHLITTPSPQVTLISHGVQNQHYPIYDVPPRKVQSGDIRRIRIEKESEPLGIQIRCLERGGVYVSSVTQNSLASQVGLSVGDQLLEVCGINMRTATKQMASTILSHCGNSSVTMLVQYNPEKYQELEWGSSSGGSLGMASRSGTPTPRNSPKGIPRLPTPSHPLHSHGSKDENSEDDDEDLPPSTTSTLRAPLDPCDHLPGDHSYPPSARSTLTRPSHMRNYLKRQDTLPRRSNASSDSTANGQLSSSQAPEGNSSNTTTKQPPSPHYANTDPRHLYIDVKSQNLGIKMVGGNAHGIFIHSVASDSSAAKSGLRPGDRILEYNGVNLSNATAEQAACELSKPADKVTMLVQWDYQTYSQIKDQPGDSFYVRALFQKTEVGSSMELRFSKDDILFVDNTMFNNEPGLWRAWLVDEDGHKRACGTIPSKDKVEEELLSQRNIGSDLPMDSGRRGSSSSRRSFFKRKKHSRSSSRDSKELASFSDASLNSYTEASPLPDEPLPPSYLRVERLDYLVRRPIVIVGPLCDQVYDKLTQDVPLKFVRCTPEIHRCSQADVDNWLQKNLIVDYRRRSNHYEITFVSQVKEICDKSLHGILDISLGSVERLHRHNIYPIVLALKFKHYKIIREISDQHLSQKEAKEMFDITSKTEQEYKHLISAVIAAGVNMAYICTQVQTIVDKEQSKTLWVSAGSL